MHDFFPLIVGLLGSLHCLGMCGPLVFAYSLHLANGSTAEAPSGLLSWSRASANHLAFHFGRLLTYGLLGGLAGGLFGAARLSRFFSGFGDILNVSGGVALAILGLVVLKVLPLPSFSSDIAGESGSFLGKRFRRLLCSRSPGSGMMLGMATGTLPCCLSWAMIVTAATTRDPVGGCFTMLLFGLGTVPALFIAGLSSCVLSSRIRSLGERVTGFVLMIMGVILVLRGVKILD